MMVRFWGVRGSIPTPLSNDEIIERLETTLKRSLKAGITQDSQIKAFVQSLPWHIQSSAGGNTTCVEVRAGNQLIILDAGTGLRLLGKDLVKKSKGKLIEAHILLSHTHWDHVCGIPFFDPGYALGNRITLYGPFKSIEKRIKQMQTREFFPVPLSSNYQFVQLDEHDRFHLEDVHIETIPLNHPGKSYGYRITHQGKTLVYATDSEYKDLACEPLKPYIQFFSHADLLIFDAQYTMVESVEKENWGHSNIFCGIDMAIEASVKHVAFTHHEPTYNDKKLSDILYKARQYLALQQTDHRPELTLAYEGLQIEL